MFSCNTGAINEARERALKSEALINYRLTDELGFHMQSCKYLRKDAYSGNCVFCICFLMFSSQVLSLFLSCVCQGLYISG